MPPGTSLRCSRSSPHAMTQSITNTSHRLFHARGCLHSMAGRIWLPQHSHPQSGGSWWSRMWPIRSGKINSEFSSLSIPCRKNALPTPTEDFHVYMEHYIPTENPPPRPRHRKYTPPRHRTFMPTQRESRSPRKSRAMYHLPDAASTTYLPLAQADQLLRTFELLTPTVTNFEAGLPVEDS